MRRVDFLHYTILVALLAAAVILRARHLDFAIPYIVNTDEMTNFNILQSMVAEGDPNPHFFRYPTFMFYLGVPGQLVVSFFTDGISAITKQTLGTGHIVTPAAFVAARLVSLVFGVLIVALVWVWARRADLGAATAIVAAGLAALGPLLIRHSTYMTPDVIASFFATAAVFASTMILRSPMLKWYLLAGAMAGLAASTKYNAGLVVVVIVVAHFQAVGLTFRGLGMLIAAGVASVAALLVASPYLLLDFPNAVAGLQFELNHYKRGHPGAEGETLRTNARWLYAQTGFGLALVVGSLASPRLRSLVPAMVFVVAYFGLISIQEVRFERNILPILPATYLLMAAGASAIATLLVRVVKAPEGLAAILALGLAGIAFVGPLSRMAAQYVHYDPDPNKEARDWLEQVIPADAKVVLDAYSPYLSPKGREISTSVFVLNEDLDWFDGHTHVVVTNKGSGRYLRNTASEQAGVYGALEASSCEVLSFKDGAPAWSIVVFKFDC